MAETVFYYMGIAALIMFLTAGLLVPIFYFFLNSLLQKPEQMLPSINTGSWHFKLAYPFRKFAPETIPEPKLFGYIFKIVSMIVLGWPLLITWQTAKIVAYTPFMILFGFYPKPGLYTMRREENPFAVSYNRIYLPSVIIRNEKVELLPVFIPSLIGLGFLTYKYLPVVLTLAILVLMVTLLIISLNHIYTKGGFGYIRKVLRSAIPRRLITLKNKYNREITIVTRDGGMNNE